MGSGAARVFYAVSRRHGWSRQYTARRPPPPSSRVATFAGTCGRPAGSSQHGAEPLADADACLNASAAPGCAQLRADAPCYMFGGRLRGLWPGGGSRGSPARGPGCKGGGEGREGAPQAWRVTAAHVDVCRCCCRLRWLCVRGQCGRHSQSPIPHLSDCSPSPASPIPSAPFSPPARNPPGFSNSFVAALLRRAFEHSRPLLLGRSCKSCLGPLARIKSCPFYSIHHKHLLR